MLFPVIRNSTRPALQSCRFQNRRLLSSQIPFFEVSEEIREAVHSGKPVVALETTIYTHGFPYPDNVALSSLLESRVRQHGAIPATIGVLQGVAKVGMQPEEIIQLLETTGSPDTIKLSRRDLSYICGAGIAGRKLNGGTTIAGTMVLAHLAGIKVFATGGLGGVHKGGENSMDVSADLTELGRTPVTLISSGCKSFLDIPRTLEYLETQGVAVGTFADGRQGQVDFPAFWTRDSGVRSPTTIQNEREAAAMIYAQRHFPLTSGLFFANPISEEFSLPKELMDEAMAQAVRDAEDQGISGSDNTPFVLSRIKDITNNATVAANRALVDRNVERGAKVAVELAKLEINDTVIINSRIQLSSPKIHKLNESIEPRRNIDVLVAGSIAVDLSCDYLPSKGPQAAQAPLPHTSNPAQILQSVGGVGQNIATACHYFGADIQLCSMVGDDLAGKSVLADLESRGLDTREIRINKEGKPTAQYVAVNDSRKDLVLAMADMRILEGHRGTFEERWKPTLERLRPKWLAIDGNWDAETLQDWIGAAKAIGTKVAFEPVSVEKSVRLLHQDWKGLLNNLLETKSAEDQRKPRGVKLVDLATPNAIEAIAMAKAIQGMDAWVSFLAALPKGFVAGKLAKRLETSSDPINVEAAAAALRLISRIPCVLTKLGANGVLLTEALAPGDARLSDPSASKYILCRKGHVSLPAGDSTFSIPISEDSSSLDSIEGVYVRHFPIPEAIEPEKMVSVNGVGDTFVGILVAGLARSESQPMERLIDHAQRGAALTLQSASSVSPKVKDLKG